MDACDKRPIQGPGRCIKEEGHKGPHEAILADAGHVEWPNKADKKPKMLKGTGRLKARSEPKKLDDAYWAGIKAAFLYFEGPVCANCGVVVDYLELDHIIPRSAGGKSEPRNAQLLCAGPGSCHARKTGEVQFSASR